MKHHIPLFKNLTASLFLVILIVCIAYSTLAVPQLPAAFYGIASINGRDAPVNSIIVAQVNGIEKGRVSVLEAGKYGDLNSIDGHTKLLVNDAADGDAIYFYIQTSSMSNWIQAEETATWEQGATTELDLTFTGTEVPVSSGTPASSAPSGGSGGGGGGGSGSKSTTASGQNTTASSSQNSSTPIQQQTQQPEPKTKELSGESTTVILAKGDKIDFTFNNKPYSITVKAIGPDSAILSASFLNDEVIEKGQPEEFDIDGNEKADIVITLNDIDENKISLTVTKKAIAASKGILPITGAAVSGVNGNPLIGVIIIIIIIAIGVGTYFILRKK